MSRTPYRSVNHERFAELLQQVPRLVPYWDFERGEMKAEELKCAIAKWSRGEEIMARFFAGVWLGENSWQFDFIEAASVLDSRHMNLVTDWMDQPFWP